MLIKKYPEDFQVDEVLEFKDGKYLVFKVKKTNRDTLDVIHDIAKNTGIQFGRIGYAGLKDRHAVTIQNFSVDNIYESTIKKLELNNVELFDFRKGQKIEVGDLLGNNFNILVRDLPENFNETIISNIKKIEHDSGFPNLFGEQRFGGNEKIGEFVLRGRFKEAVERFLLKENLTEDTVNYIKDGDFEKALDFYPNLHNEKQVIAYLSKSLDYTKAFRVLPPTVSSLFIHAYQAKIFNEAVLERIKQTPLNEVELGDIVSMQRQGDYYRTQVNKSNIERVKSGMKNGEINVIAPLIGYNSIVPKSALGKLTIELIEKDGITKDSFRVEGATFLESSGAYRNILGGYKDLLYAPENEGARFKFFLYKGEYATIFLKYLTSSLS